MTDIQPFYILASLISGLVQLAMLIICIVLVFKNKNTATMLMLIGSILTILFYIANVVWPAIASLNGAESVVKSVAILNVLGNISYVIFTIGFALFVIKHVQKRF